MKSQRADGRGHWPAGRRRNPLAVKVMPMLLWLYHGHGLSYRRLARHCRADPKSVWAWVAGVKHPAKNSAARIARLYARVIAARAKERGGK